MRGFSARLLIASALAAVSASLPAVAQPTTRKQPDPFDSAKRKFDRIVRDHEVAKHNAEVERRKAERKARKNARRAA